MDSKPFKKQKKKKNPQPATQNKEENTGEDNFTLNNNNTNAPCNQSLLELAGNMATKADEPDE